MEVSHSRRILAVSLTQDAPLLSRFTSDLTKTSLVTPTPEDTSSLAGTTHTLSFETAYYTADVPVWLDLITSPSEWTSSFLSPEAKEVLDALGGMVIVFALSDAILKTGAGGMTSSESTQSATEELLREVGKVVRDGLAGWEWDGVALAVGVSEGHSVQARTLERLEDLCGEFCMEFVHATTLGGVEGGAGHGLNDFGEKQGMARVREALEANEWESSHEVDGLDLGDDNDNDNDTESIGSKDADVKDFDPSLLSFGHDSGDFEGLRQSILGRASDTSLASSTSDLNDEDVQKVEQMMRKLQAVREAGQGMPETQRRRMAARAVTEVMKKL